MTRIRYEKVNGMLISKPVFTGRTNLVVTMFVETLTFNIVDGTVVVVEGTGRTLPELKRNVKNELLRQGVTFNDEVRTKKIKTES